MGKIIHGNGIPVILLVNQNSGFLRYFHFVLTGAGYAVFHEQDWISALAFQWKFPFRIDLLITNLGKGPNPQGLRLAACYHLSRPDTEILFTSGGNRPEPETMAEALPGRRIHFLRTPFTASEAKNLVARLVNQVPDEAAIAAGG